MDVPVVERQFGGEDFCCSSKLNKHCVMKTLFSLGSIVILIQTIVAIVKNILPLLIASLVMATTHTALFFMARSYYAVASLQKASQAVADDLQKTQTELQQTKELLNREAQEHAQAIAELSAENERLQRSIVELQSAERNTSTNMHREEKQERDTEERENSILNREQTLVERTGTLIDRMQRLTDSLNGSLTDSLQESDV